MVCVCARRYSGTERPYSLGDFVRAEEGGHGTHVAGTLAGAVSGAAAGDDENDGADGIAYQGKLAVFDFGDSDAFNSLTTPDQV